MPLTDPAPRPTPVPAPPGPDTPAHALAVRLARAREVVEFAVHKAQQARLPQVAASLTFSSVLALVPLLAVILAVFTAFPQFAQLRSSLEQELPRSLLPVPYAQTILRYLSEFASKAAGVGAAGLLLLGVTALSMILTVDRILNDIWQVHQRRPLAQRLLVYWAFLSLGPVLVGLSLSVSSYLLAWSDPSVTHPGAGLRSLLQLVSPLIGVAAYSAAYALVPNRRVAWRHAIIGGIVTALTDELMSRGFAAYVMHGSFLSVYGAFAAVPIFLTWIYLSWLTFLFGAAIAATLPQLRHTRFNDSKRAGNRAITAVALIKLLYDARRDGVLRAVALRELAQRLRTDDQDLSALLADLETLGYARQLVAAEGAAEEWILACDPQTRGLAAVFHRYALDPGNSLLHSTELDLYPWLAPALDGSWLQLGLAHIGSAPAVTRGAAGTGDAPPPPARVQSGLETTSGRP